MTLLKKLNISNHCLSYSIIHNFKPFRKAIHMASCNIQQVTPQVTPFLSCDTDTFNGLCVTGTIASIATSDHGQVATIGRTFRLHKLLLNGELTTVYSGVTTETYNYNCVYNDTFTLCLFTTNGQIVVINVHTLEIICTINIRNVQSLQFYPNNDICVSTTSDIRKYNLKGELLETTDISHNTIVKISPNGLMRLCSTGKTLKVSSNVDHVINCGILVQSMVFSPRGEWFVVGGVTECDGGSGKIIIYDSTTLQIIHTFTQNNIVTKVAVSPNGKLIAFNNNYNIAILNSETGQPVCELVGHNAKITCIAFDYDGHVVSSSLTSIKWWNIPFDDLIESTICPDSKAPSVESESQVQVTSSAEPESQVQVTSSAEPDLHA